MTRYKPTGPRALIDAEACLLQAASALDAAAERAENTNDVEGLLNVSAMWMKFSETIEGLAQHRLEQDSPMRSNQEFTTGFQAAAKTKGEIDD